MKVKINGYVTAIVPEYSDEPVFSWYSFDASEFDTKSVVLSRKEIELEIPDDFDIRIAKIATLEREADQVRAEFSQKIDEINEHISKLRALEYNDGK